LGQNRLNLHPGSVIRSLPSGLRLHAGGLPDRPQVSRGRHVLGNGSARRDADAKHRAGVDEVVTLQCRLSLRSRRASVRRRVCPTSR